MTLKQVKQQSETNIETTTKSLSYVLSEDPLCIFEHAYGINTCIEEKIYLINYIGYIIPILPFPLSLYNHLRYSKNKYYGVDIHLAIRDSIIHQLILLIKEDEELKDKKELIINNSIPIIFHWFPDLELPIWDISNPLGSRLKSNGKLVYRNKEMFVICKKCFKLIEGRDIPSDKLCKECEHKYYYYFCKKQRIFVHHIKRKLKIILALGDKGELEKDVWIKSSNGNYKKSYNEIARKYIEEVKEDILKVASSFRRALLGTEPGKPPKKMRLMKPDFDPYDNKDFYNDIYAHKDSPWYKEWFKLRDRHQVKGKNLRTYIIETHGLKRQLKNHVLYGAIPVVYSKKLQKMFQEKLTFPAT